MSNGSERVISWRKRTKLKMISSMGGRCQACGYKACVEALEFHHIDPSQKEIAFGKMRANPVGIAKVFEELKKCILLCANCHREVHSGIRELPMVFATVNMEILLGKPSLQ